MGSLGDCSLMSLSQFMHLHDFIATWVDDFHCGASMLPWRERQRFSSRERLEPLGVNRAIKCFTELLPGGFVGEESLGNAEGAPVVIAIDEPRCNLGVFYTANGVGQRIVDVHPFHDDRIFAVAVRSIELRAGLTEDCEKLTARLIFEQSVHSWIDVGPDMGNVNA